MTIHRSNNPLVAVIIPVYNGSAFIQEAIKSVLDQDINQLELIVVDDGSTDNTVDLVSRFPAVKVFRQPRRGASAARNFGISHSTAPVLKFLDADDYLEPGILKKQIQLATTLPANVIPYGYARVFGSRPWSTKRKFIPWDDQAESLILENIATPLPLYRRSVLEQLGGFNEAIGFRQEKNLNVRLSLAGYLFYYHDDLTGHIRNHRQSTRISNRVRVVEEELKNLELIFADYLNYEEFKGYDAFACFVWRIGRVYELSNDIQGAALLYAKAEEIAQGDFKRFLSLKEKLSKRVNGPKAASGVRTFKKWDLYVMDSWVNREQRSGSGSDTVSST